MRAMPLSAVLLSFACVACSPPRPPDPATPPAPKATELRDAIQAPIDRAKAVQGTVDADAERTRKDLEDAGG